jgi:hypothetical protein
MPRGPSIGALPEHLQGSEQDIWRQALENPVSMEKLGRQLGSQRAQEKRFSKQDWDALPSINKFMEVLQYVPDVLDLPLGVAKAGIFPLGKIAKAKLREQFSGIEGFSGQKRQLEALRDTAARYLKWGRGSVYKKGTPLGEMSRDISMSPLKKGSTELISPSGQGMSAASIMDDIISLPMPEGVDPGVAMHILGHEKGHAMINRLRRVAKSDIPEAKKAKKILDVMEQVAATQGFRGPESAMGKTMFAADSPFPDISTIPGARKFAEKSRAHKGVFKDIARAGKPHTTSGTPEGAMAEVFERSYADPKLLKLSKKELREKTVDVGEQRFNERLSDLWSSLLTPEGQKSLTSKERELLSTIMDLY